MGTPPAARAREGEEVTDEKDSGLVYLGDLPAEEREVAVREAWPPREEWGPGPWQDEPDHASWPFDDGEHYRDETYMRAEVERLAEQLATLP